PQALGTLQLPLQPGRTIGVGGGVLAALELAQEALRDRVGARASQPTAERAPTDDPETQDGDSEEHQRQVPAHRVILTGWGPKRRPRTCRCSRSAPYRMARGIPGRAPP